MSMNITGLYPSLVLAVLKSSNSASDYRNDHGAQVLLKKLRSSDRTIQCLAAGQLKDYASVSLSPKMLDKIVDKLIQHLQEDKSPSVQAACFQTLTAFADAHVADTELWAKIELALSMYQQ